MQRLSKVEASDANSTEKVYQINSCQTVGTFVMTKANRTEDFQDVYGHIDPMEGCYNILKLKVLDEKDVAYVSKSCVSPQNENYYMKAENTISTTTSKIWSNIDADELMSKKLIKEKKWNTWKISFKFLIVQKRETVTRGQY